MGIFPVGLRLATKKNVEFPIIISLQWRIAMVSCWEEMSSSHGDACDPISFAFVQRLVIVGITAMVWRWAIMGSHVTVRNVEITMCPSSVTGNSVPEIWWDTTWSEVKCFLLRSLGTS